MTQNRHSFRLRFSILNLLFFGVTVAALAGLYRSWQTIQQLTDSRQAVLEENARLRAEQGVLTIEDPTKIHAIQIADPRDNVWSYRVNLPVGRRYYFAGLVNGLPLDGEPPRFGPGEPPDLRTIKGERSERGGSMTANGCSPGEHLVSIALSRDDQGRKVFRARMTPTTPGADGAMIGIGIRDEPGKWPAVELDPPDDPNFILGRMERGLAVGKQTTAPLDSESFVLLELRYVHGEITSSADSDEGLIVWIGVIDSEDPPGATDP